MDKECIICGTIRDETYMIERDTRIFCSTECYRTFYTVREVNISAAGGGILSTPPTGYYKVVNIYVNPATGKLTIEYDNTPI
jgi:hypothetical protein